jgi:two-component system OmpR family sensor kinase
VRHPHHRHRLPWWRMHWRLRRRLFAWFGVAVGVSASLGAYAVHCGVSPAWAIAGMAIALWMASGAIAWRLTMPLAELARVARQLGDGQLDARMRPGGRGARELTAIADAINDMAARIEKQLHDQRELLAAVSHEIRTPLGHMRVLLDTARDRGFAEEVIGEIEREVLEVDALVDQLLASSRLEFGHLERRELDVAVEAARALERLGVDASVLDVQADACTVSADPTLLRSALANLVRNAIDHGGGVAGVTVRRTDGTIEVEVDDAGPGFTAADLPRVFEPFYRGAERAGGSLGLGLSLVDRVARAHGGGARAGTRGDRGARVTIALPAA